MAVLCALTIWLLGVFSASAHLHESLHAEADHQDHACAITLFSQGLDSPLACVALVLAPAEFPAGVVLAPSAAPVSEMPGRLPPGRGPPLC